MKKGNAVGAVIGLAIVSSPLWAILLVLVMALAPGTRLYLLPGTLAGVTIGGGYLGMLVERHLMPTVRAERRKPWVPLAAVERDVARKLEQGLDYWLSCDRVGVPRIDYEKLARLAIDTAARSAIRRKRSAAVRALLEGRR